MKGIAFSSHTSSYVGKDVLSNGTRCALTGFFLLWCKFWTGRWCGSSLLWGSVMANGAGRGSIFVAAMKHRCRALYVVWDDVCYAAVCLDSVLRASAAVPFAGRYQLVFKA